jgi:acyl-CoA reductase-like NAD-dependent aldehyde dehydrogenase
LYKTFDEVVDKINELGKPLAIYYMGSKSNKNYKRLIEETSSGAICSNEVIL